MGKPGMLRTDGKSISASFSLTLIAIVALLLIQFAIVVSVINLRRADSELQNNLQTHLQLSEVSLRIPIWNVNFEIVEAIVESLLVNNLIVRAEVNDGDDLLAVSAVDGYTEQTFEQLQSSAGLLTGSIAIEYEGELIGTLSLAMSREPGRRKMLTEIIGIVLLTLLIVGGIAGTSTFVLRRVVSAPLRRLQSSASAIASGQLDTPIDIDQNNEIGRLASDFDAMRQSIKNLVGELQTANQELASTNQTLEDRVQLRTAELEQSNAEVVESQTRLQAILDQAPVQVFLKNLEGRYLLTNDAFNQFWGLKPVQIIDKTDAEVYPAELAEQFRRSDIGVIERGRGTRFEDTRVVDGERFTNVVHKFPLFDQSGAASAICAITSDVTKMKQREEELLKTTNRLEVALSMEGVGIWEADLQQESMWWSRAYTVMLGYDPDQFVPDNDTWEKILHPDDFQRVLDEVNEFLAGTQSRTRVSQRLLRSDGTSIWVDSLMFVKRDEQGEAIVLSGLDVDVSEQLQRERSLAAFNKQIVESMHYASRIQTAMLPSRELLGRILPKHYLIWEPRDIVGGDFYWCQQSEHGRFIVVGDCTGHGVPGAFMTLITCGLLDQLIRSGEPSPAALLSTLHQQLQSLLGQDVEHGATDDGLDAGICLLRDDSDELVFSGARFSLFSYDDSGASELRGDRAGVGYRRYPTTTTFTDHIVAAPASTSFYLSTDGIFDQIGGKRRRGFGKKRFTRCFEHADTTPLPQQQQKLSDTFAQYQGEEHRRDDVTVLCFSSAQQTG